MATLDEIVAEFAALVERVKPLAALPCVCDRSSVEAHEETLTDCTPCHVASIFDETMEHAQSVTEFIEEMAQRHPKQPKKPRAVVRSNVVRFQPASKRPQPNAVWKD